MPGSAGSFFTIKASLLTYKSNPDVPKAIDPVITPPDPVVEEALDVDEPVLEDLPEPDEGELEPEPLDIEDPEEEESSALSWIFALLGLLAAGVGGLFAWDKYKRSKKI